MPFNNFEAYTFSRASVERLAPASSGVYGLSNSREWVYIGSTDNIRAALLEHVDGFNLPVSERNPTGFSFELCPPSTRIARQDRLIHEMEPTCNGNIRR